jgi:hypothetical protein
LIHALQPSEPAVACSALPLGAAAGLPLEALADLAEHLAKLPP